MAWNKLNLLGERFGRLTVIKEAGRDKHKNVRWECLCDCGGTSTCTTNTLRRGHSKSCGCLQKEVAKNNTWKDLTGRKFGRLLVIKEDDSVKLKDKGRSNWVCKCDCGNTHIVNTSSLNGRHTQSCGCIQKEGARERFSGSNHHSFRPDFTPEDRLKKRRYVLGMDNEFRNNVFIRDNYSCVICNSKNGEGKRIVFNAHHLDGWNWCREKRFDIDNMVTLCVGCHKKFHKTYGGGDNTKEQFEEFFNATKVRA